MPQRMITLRVPKEEFDLIHARAKAMGVSMNAYLRHKLDLTEKKDVSNPYLACALNRPLTNPQ